MNKKSGPRHSEHLLSFKKNLQLIRGRRRGASLGPPLSRRNLSRESDKPQLFDLNFSWVSLLGLCTSLFAAVLFSAGLAYRSHYLREYGFDVELMPWSFQDTVFLGAAQQLEILLSAPIAALTAVSLFVLLLILGRWIGSVVKARSGNRSHSDGQDDTEWLKGEWFVIKMLFTIASFVILATLFVAQAETLGKRRANDEISSLAVGSKMKPKLSMVTIERTVGGREIRDSGYLVTCSEHYCGLYSPEKAIITSKVIPLDGVTLFQHHSAM